LRELKKKRSRQNEKKIFEYSRYVENLHTNMLYGQEAKVILYTVYKILLFQCTVKINFKTKPTKLLINFSLCKIKYQCIKYDTFESFKEGTLKISAQSEQLSALGLKGALTIRPPTKRPRDTSTQAQFAHGPPPGSANKRFVVAGGGPGR
jgi:hypothetical protein